MPSQRIAANGPVNITGAALIPVPAQAGLGYQSRGIISGSPGTRRIPAPFPGGVPQDRTGMANMGTHRSQDAPPYWTPGVYYLCGPQEHAPVSVRSDNQMPVPAGPSHGEPGVVMNGPVMLGQYQVSNPAVAPKFLNR